MCSFLSGNIAYDCFPLCSKYATEIWSWKTRYWMEALHHGWKFVILDTPRWVLNWERSVWFVYIDWLLLYSVQSSLLHSRPKSTVGTPAYIAPEVLSRREYDGKVILWLLHPPFSIQGLPAMHYYLLISVSFNRICVDSLATTGVILLETRTD